MSRAKGFVFRYRRLKLFLTHGGMMKTSRALGFILAVITAVSLMVSCGNGKKESAAKPQTVTAAVLKGPTGMGMARMIYDKAQADTKHDIQYEIINTPDVLIGRVLNGSVDIAVVPANLPAVLSAKGADIKVGAVTGYGMLYVLGTDESITSVSGLKGKTVHNIGKGATPGIITNFIVRESGLVPGTDVFFDFSFSHPDLAAALAGGLVDLAVLPEPFVTKVLNKNQNVNILIDLQDEYMNITGNDNSYPMSVIIFSGELAADNHFAQSFLEKYEDSIHYVNIQKDEAAMLIAGLDFGLDLETARAAIPRCNIRFTNMKDTRENLLSYYKLLHGYKPESVGGKVPDEGLFLE